MLYINVNIPYEEYDRLISPNIFNWDLTEQMGLFESESDFLDYVALMLHGS